MLFSVNELVRVYKIKPQGVLHVGAHNAEEEKEYVSNGWQGRGKILWVEANPELAEKMRINLDPSLNLVFTGLAWGISGVEKRFYLNNFSQASSAFELGTAQEYYRNFQIKSEIILSTIRIDELINTEFLFDFINLDVQGSELEVLLGCGELLQKIKWIYTEVNHIQVYKGIPLVGEIDSYLQSQGFTRMATRWYSNSGWGDALYYNNSILMDFPSFKKRVFTSGNVVFVYQSMTNYLKRSFMNAFPRIGKLIKIGLNIIKSKDNN